LFSGELLLAALLLDLGKQAFRSLGLAEIAGEILVIACILFTALLRVALGEFGKIVVFAGVKTLAVVGAFLLESPLERLCRFFSLARFFGSTPRHEKISHRCKPSGDAIALLSVFPLVTVALGLLHGFEGFKFFRKVAVNDGGGTVSFGLLPVAELAGFAFVARPETGFEAGALLL